MHVLILMLDLSLFQHLECMRHCLDFPVQASRRGIPILIDAERPREGLDDLLKLSSYVICSAKFPQVICF